MCLCVQCQHGAAGRRRADAPTATKRRGRGGGQVRRAKGGKRGANRVFSLRCECADVDMNVDSRYFYGALTCAVPAFRVSVYVVLCD